MNSQVLVLNASYEPLNTVGVKRAMTMLFTGKASAIEGTGNYAHSAEDRIEIPYVLLMNRFVGHKKRKELPFSRKHVFSRDNYTCVYCGKHATTIDHVVPRSKGGENSYENCVASCAKCNSKKGSKTLEQLGWKLPFTPKSPSPYALLMNRVSPRSHVAKVWEPYIQNYSH